MIISGKNIAINRIGGINLINQNLPTGSGTNTFITDNLKNELAVKLNQDEYEIYVNGSYVGKKALKNQGERLSDIDDFLNHQGIQNFTSNLEGDHYVIQSDGQNNDIVDALNVYFNNR